MDLRARYRLTAWLSPAFPTGGYTYSHGLEHAVEAGLVRDRATLRAWIAGILEFGAGWTDALFFCAAHRARPAEVDDLAELAAAMKGTRELRAESLLQGKAFDTAVAAAWEPDGGERALDDRPLAYPIAVARACRRHGVPLAEALPAYLQATVAGLVSAGLRLVPLGHTDGQRVLASLEEVVVGAAARARCTPFAELGSASPMVDWASMRHETQHTRLFRS